MPRKKRKEGAKKCASVGSKKKIGDKTYTLKARRKSKTEAKKLAESHRKKGKGKLARVVKDGCGYCIMTRG